MMNNQVGVQFRYKPELAFGKLTYLHCDKVYSAGKY